MEGILKVIQAPTTGTGRQYILHGKIQKSITELFQEQ
jgi:hypothetical protein